MLRTNLIGLATIFVLLAGIATGGALAAADNSITIGPSKVPVKKSGTAHRYSYRFAIPVTCTPSETATACNGLLSIETVAIKPYQSIARKKWPVGALPFSIPAGTTKPVPGRLLAGALVQLKLTGKVRVIVRILREGTVVGSKPMTLTRR